MAQWLSWLERRPVTAEVESSSLFWVVWNAQHSEECRSGGTGRRTGLKILRDLYSRTGSIPVCGSD